MILRFSAFERARELCQQVEQTPQLFPVLWGLWMFSTARARHQTALELGEQLLALAQHTQDTALLLEAHHALWTTAIHLGEVVTAHAHTKQGITLCRCNTLPIPSGSPGSTGTGRGSAGNCKSAWVSVHRGIVHAATRLGTY